MQASQQLPRPARSWRQAAGGDAAPLPGDAGEIASDRSNTILFPFPMELRRLLDRLAEVPPSARGS